MMLNPTNLLVVYRFDEVIYAVSGRSVGDAMSEVNAIFNVRAGQISFAFCHERPWSFSPFVLNPLTLMRGACA